MDHRIFKALVNVANNTAGYFEHRNINEKKEYTFDGITLTSLGNSNKDGDPGVAITYYLKGVQFNKVQSPNYQSDSAEIGSVQLDIRCHGWTTGDGNT
jgi:hypothetical protein